MDGRRRMQNSGSDNSCSLPVCGKWRVCPVEYTSLLLTNSVDCLDSFYHIPNDIFCSSRSHLSSYSWMVCMDQLVCIPCGVMFHLIFHNDLDRNPFIRSIGSMDLSTAMYILLFYNLIPVGCICLSFSWFLIRCWSPVCHNAHRMHVLLACCLTRLLLLTLESILLFNSMEMEWCVLQHLYWQGHHWGCEYDG